MKSPLNRLPGSFRDPSGFIFIENGKFYRTVNYIYQQNYDHLMQSGLYEKLVEDGLLVPHVEVTHTHNEPNNKYKILQPELIPFISYPYEWCFSQLQDAALALIKVQEIALDFNMILKDASAYNIQFFKGKPVLIDTLSFEIYKENQPWVAYRQFCQHFLAPLALMGLRDTRYSQLLRIYIDGIPLNLVSSMLPVSTWFNFGLLSHIHLHAKAQKRYESKAAQPLSPTISKHSLVALTHHLGSTISSMKWQPEGTEWAEYYEDTNYSREATNHKKHLVSTFLDEIKPVTVWDIGANIGLYSRIAMKKMIDTIAFDIDPVAVEKNYLQMRKNKETRMLPLCLDLTNPSPAIGWANEERLSLAERGPVDTIMALALIHHLAISNNLPFNHIAAFLSRICRFLIIEFVPKDDLQVQRLLSSREDIFCYYNPNHFETVFGDYFSLLKCERITDTQRTLYLMKNKANK